MERDPLVADKDSRPVTRITRNIRGNVIRFVDRLERLIASTTTPAGPNVAAHSEVRPRKLRHGRQTVQAAHNALQDIGCACRVRANRNGVSIPPTTDFKIRNRPDEIYGININKRATKSARPTAPSTIVHPPICGIDRERRTKQQQVSSFPLGRVHYASILGLLMVFLLDRSECNRSPCLLHLAAIPMSPTA